MADEGLAKKDRICQFFASNAGLHFRSIDVAAALGLDARSVGQQLARLWRSGFVEKVQTGPFTTWRMKFQTYPGRNLHGPAAPKPASLTQHTPAKKSTRGSRTHEEGRNDSGHCAMGSSVVFGSTEGGNQEGEEEEDEAEDQGSCLVEAHSVRVPEYHSSSSKPPSATRDGPTSTQNISSQCKAAENPPIKKTVGRPPGNKNKMSTTCQIGQRGFKTGKTSSTSGSCKKKTSAPVKRRVGPEPFKNADQRTGKGKKTTSQITSREDCSSRSDKDTESSSLKIVPTGLKRKLGVDSKNTAQGLKKKVKKTRTQTTGREDSSRSSDSSLSTQVQKKTQLVPVSVSYQKTAATTVKKKTGQEQKRKIKKTTSPNKEGYCSSTCSTSGKDSIQLNPSAMPATLAPSLNRPSGNMETKLMNFIREAQGMLVMTGDDVAKALGSKPKETHRLLLHMQRTGRVRKVCDKPTRWMMLGQGKGGPARKRQTEAVTTTTTQQKELPSLTTAQQREPLPQTQHQVPSTQTYRSFSIDGSPTRRRQIEVTTTTQQKEPPSLPKHQVPSTQTYRRLSTDGSTEGGTSKTSYSATDLSECGQNGQRLAHHMSTCEEEEDSEEVASTSNEVCPQFGKDLLTTEEEEDLEDVNCVSQEEDSGFLEDATFYTERKKPSPRVQQASSLPSKKQSRKSSQKSQGEDIGCVFQEQDSGFLDDVTFYAERKKSSPTVQHALSLPSKKQSKTSNKMPQVTISTKRSLSPCGKKTLVKKQVLTDKQSVRNTTEHGSSCSKPPAAKSTSLEKVQSQKSNHTGLSNTSCQAKTLELSNFRIPKKSTFCSNELGKRPMTVGQKSRDLCGGKGMNVAPSELDNNLLDSSKDSAGKTKQDTNTQRDISTIKTPPHILKHSVSYFASTTKEPNTKPKLPRPSKTTKDIPKSQEKRETSFVRAKDNAISTKEPLADIDVVVDVTVDKSPQIQNQLHYCGTCSSNQDLQHTPLSVLRRNSTRTPTSGPPKLYPQRAKESIGKQCKVGTLGSCDSPPVLVPIEEELRSLGMESPTLRAARRNLNPCFSLEENFLSSQDTGTDPRRAHGRGVYAEIKDTSRVTGGEVIGQAGHGSRHSMFTNLHEEQHGSGHAGSQEERRSNTAANLNSLEPRKAVSKASIGRMASFIPVEEQHRMTNIEDRAHHMATNPCCSQGLVGNNRQAKLNSLEPGKAVSKARLGERASFNPTKQHRITDSDGRAHHMGPVPGAEQSVHHPLDYHRTGHTFTDTKQHRITDIDGRAHCMDPVPGAEVLVHHPPGYHRTDHTCSVHQMDSSGQGGNRRHLGGPQKPEKVHQALVTRQTACFGVSAPREVPRMSVGGYEEKLVRGTIDLTQEKRSTKTSWPKPTDYWCDGVQDVFHAKDRKLSSGTEELLTTSTYAASEAKARRCISRTEETVAHTTTAHTASDNILPAKVRNLLFGTEEEVPHTTATYTESEAKARCISSTEDTVAHTTTAHTESDNILPAKVRNLLFGTEKAVPDITSMHTASEDVFPAIARRLSFGTEETVPQTTARHTASEGVLAKARRLSFDAEVTVPLRSTYTASEAKTMLSPGTEETVPPTTTTHTVRSNVGHSSKSENVSILEEEAIHAKVSNWSVQNGKLCKVCEPPLGNLERVTSTSGAGTVVPSYVTKSMQPSHDCRTTANCKGASTQATRSPTVHNQPSSTGSVPVLGADHHVHYKGVKQSPINPEGLCISEKSLQNESTKWQRPRSPKSFWIDYWSKAESKDTKNDDLKDRSAENSRLVACSTTNADNVVSPKETSSDLIKNYSKSKVCAMEVLSKDNANLRDEKSLTVAKKEPKIFRTTETQTSQGFADTSPIQRDKIVDLRQDSQILKDLSDDVDVKVCLVEKVGSSLTGPVEQSTWTQPKALYTTDERRPQEQKGPQSQEPRGQEAAVDEVRGHDGSEVQEPRGQEQAAVVKARGHDGSEFESRGQEPAVDGARSHDRSEFEPRDQREAAGDEARGHDGSEVGQVSRHQVTVAMVTPQGSRPVVMAAQPSGPSLHPAQPVPVLQQKHPIMLLNELCQRNHLPMCFQDISVTGPAHRPRVQVAAVVGDCTFQAEASSKKAARRQAAREALQALYQEGYK